MKALILAGLGINCEKESALACRLAGLEASVQPVQLLLKGKIRLEAYQLLCLPGGFSFGDELGAGKAFSNRMRPLKGELLSFVDSGGSILGICNGFQILLKLGLLPFGEEQLLSLAPNSKGRFENRWTYQLAPPSRCPFTDELGLLRLPVRHAEGRLIAKDEETLALLKREGLIALYYADAEGLASSSYPENPNGSSEAVAGLCDRSGRILGMMAHPEAALFAVNHPGWTKEKEREGLASLEGDGRKIFSRIADYYAHSNHLMQCSR